MPILPVVPLPRRLWDYATSFLCLRLVGKLSIESSNLFSIFCFLSSVINYTFGRYTVRVDELSKFLALLQSTTLAFFTPAFGLEVGGDWQNGNAILSLSTLPLF